MCFHIYFHPQLEDVVKYNNMVIISATRVRWFEYLGGFSCEWGQLGPKVQKTTNFFHGFWRQQKGQINITNLCLESVWFPSVCCIDILKDVQRFVAPLRKRQVAPSDTWEQTLVALWAVSGGKLFLIHFWGTVILVPCISTRCLHWEVQVYRD